MIGYCEVKNTSLNYRKQWKIEPSQNNRVKLPKIN